MADTFENKINSLKAIYKGRVPDDDLKKLTEEALQIIKDFRENKAIKYAGPIAAGIGDVLVNIATAGVMLPSGFAPFSEELKESREKKKDAMTQAKQAVFDQLKKKLNEVAQPEQRAGQFNVRNILPAVPAGQYVGAGAGQGMVGVQQERTRPSEDELLAELPESLREKVKKTFEPVLPRS